MKKIYLKEYVEGLKDYPIEVTNSIFEIMETLDNNYGVNRNIEDDLKGYILVV